VVVNHPVIGGRIQSSEFLDHVPGVLRNAAGPVKVKSGIDTDSHAESITERQRTPKLGIGRW
jgi:hypothetical protein